MRRYSEAVKADIRKRMSPPARQSVARISEETGIHICTLYAWRKGWRLEPESFRVVEIPWGLSPGVAGAEMTTAPGSGA